MSKRLFLLLVFFAAMLFSSASAQPSSTEEESDLVTQAANSLAEFFVSSYQLRPLPDDFTVTNSETGCSAVVPARYINFMLYARTSDKPYVRPENTFFTWTGNCDDGLISGEGTLEIFSEEKNVWTYVINEGNGLTLRDGAVEYKSVLSDFGYSIECERYNTGSADAWPIRSVALQHPQVSVGILLELVSLIAEECDAGNINNIHIWPGPDGEASGFRMASLYRNRDTFLWNSSISDEFVREAEDAWRQEEQERLAAEREARQRAEEEERARQEAERQERIATERAVIMEMFSQHEVEEVTSVGRLFANPFFHEGTNIALGLRFERMVAADAALFTEHRTNEEIVLRNVPTTKFVEPNTSVIVAAHVVGIEGNTLIVEYLDSYDCNRTFCDAYLP